jgi:energy-coupling factor transport system ATP-binding protein
MIEICNLTISYDRPVIADISLRLQAGEYVLLTGPSGSGKSTLALAIAGMIPQLIPAAMQGQILIAGRDTRALAVSELAQTVGMVFQNPATQLFHELVEEEIAFGPRNLGLAEIEIAARVESALQMTGIAALCGRVVRALSGGEQQRVAIAAALAMRPRLLILDEPLANLDQIGAAQVLAALDALHQQGVTILLVEHRLELVAARAQRILLLDQGKLVADGPAAQIVADRALLDRLGLRHPRAASEARCAECATLLPTSRKPLVVLKEVAAAYGARRVFSGLDLTLLEGEFVALLGDNGSGKTTLARLLAGILRPKSGRIRWAAAATAGQPRVGLLFQNPQHQLVCDTIQEETAYGLENLRRAKHLSETDLLEAIRPYLAAADLDELRSRSPLSLSAGQQQRAALAATLSIRPRLLILDEPTLGQDWAHLSRLMDYVAALHRQGQSILLITHDNKLVHRYASRLLRLEKGRIHEISQAEAVQDEMVIA